MAQAMAAFYREQRLTSSQVTRAVAVAFAIEPKSAERYTSRKKPKRK